MTAQDAIDAYLEQLAMLLRPRKTAGRIVEEVSDHLHEAVAQAVAAGATDSEAARAAIVAFGPPMLVAARFEVELNTASALRMSALAVAALALTAVAQLPEATLDLSSTAPWLSNAIDTPVIFLGGQVAVVAGVVTGLRWLARRNSLSVDQTHRRLLLRGSAVTLGALAAVQLPEAISALAHVDQVRASGASIALALSLVPQVVLLGMACSITFSAWRNEARSAFANERIASPRADAAPAPGMAGVFEDVAAIAAPVVGWGRRPRPLGGRRSSALLAIADPRLHPWRFCLVVAVVVGAAQSAAAGVATGTPSLSHVAAGTAIEATAVCVGFSVLGGLLGLRRPLLRRKGRDGEC